MKPIAKVGIGCLVIVVTCIGGFGIFLLRVATGSVNPSTDYAGQIEDLVAAEQASNATQPNRWPEMVALLERATKLNQEIATKRSLQARGDDTTKQFDPSVLRGEPGIADIEKEQVAARDLLEALKTQNVFRDIRNLGQSGRYVRPIQKKVPLIETMLPDLPWARGFSRDAAAQMRETNLAGNYDSYLEAFESGCVVGQNYMRQGVLIDRLVGQAMFTLTLSELEQGIIEKPLPAEVIKECMMILDRASVVPGPALSLETERRSVKDTIQWTYSDTGGGNGYFMANSKTAGAFWGSGLNNGGPQLFGPLGGMFLAGRAATTKKADELFDGMIHFAKTPRNTRVHGTFQPDVEVERLSGRYLMLKMLFPALSSMAASNDQCLMNFAATRQLLATELYMREHGEEPPKTAAELVPTYLKELPTDPINGSPFGYLVFKPGEDPYGRKYLLYSLGSDNVDDHGVQAPNAKDRMSAVKMTTYPTPGLDLVINEPGSGAKKKNIEVTPTTSGPNAPKK